MNEDECMMFKHAEEYGDGVDWAEKGQGFFYRLQNDKEESDSDSKSAGCFDSLLLNMFKCVRC